MKYRVVTDDWDYDFPEKPIEECTLFESDDLEKCKKYAKKHGIKQGNIVKNNGRIAIGDWYGAYDNDLGWEYD